MNIRKSLLLEILADLEKRAREAQWKLDENKHSIKRLAEEQKTLKQKRQEIGKLLGEIQRQVKP